MRYEKLYSGISKIAWGYIFIYFDFKINNITLLPAFVGFILFVSAIEILKEEESELSLLYPFGVMLVIWHIVKWIGSWFAMDIESIAILNIIISLISVYFYFQLLTNLASIAAKYQPMDVDFSEKLLKYRTVQTVMFTGTMILTYLYPWLGEAGMYISLVMSIVYLIVGICLIVTLFRLRNLFRGDIV